MRYILLLSALALAACARPANNAQAADTPVQAPAAEAAAVPAAGAASTVPAGNYECWANGEANLTLNFTVTGPGRYTASDGSTGTFTVADDGTATFTGYEGDVMPAGFTINYHLAQGRPTFSFIGTSGGEAAFCEKAD